MFKQNGSTTFHVSVTAHYNHQERAHNNQTQILLRSSLNIPSIACTKRGKTCTELTTQLPYCLLFHEFIWQGSQCKSTPSKMFAHVEITFIQISNGEVVLFYAHDKTFLLVICCTPLSHTYTHFSLDSLTSFFSGIFSDQPTSVQLLVQCSQRTNDWISSLLCEQNNHSV